MGIIQKAANFGVVSGPGYELGHGSTNVFSPYMGMNGSDINVLEEYQGFAWKVINIRAMMLSAEDLFVERLVGQRWQEDVAHEFNDVMEGSDGQRDLSEMLEAHSKSMDLFGEAFWYFSTGEHSGLPMGAYLLDPNYVTVLVAGERIQGFIYQKEGNRIVLDIDEVMYKWIEDPRRPFRGYGPMQAAGWFIKSARYVTTYVNNFMENNAIPAGVVVAKGEVDGDDWELFKKQWTEKHTGIDNAGKTGFVRGSDLDFVQTGLSLGEVDFEKLKNASRDDVMVMFGISKPMMAIFDDINRASATVARQLFAMTFTKPELKSLTRKLTKKVANWYGKQYRVSSTNPVPEDEDAKLQKFDKGVGRWFTVNEARAAYGEEPISGGDELNPDTRASTNSNNEGTKSFLARKTIGKIVIREKKIEEPKKTFSNEEKEAFRSASEALQLKHEDKIYKATDKLLKEQEKMVIAQLEPKKLIDAHFDTIDESKKLASEILPIIIDLAKAQGVLATELVGGDGSSFSVTAVMERYIADSIERAALSFTEETQSYIAKAIADGLAEEESTVMIGKRINQIYKDITGVSAPGYRISRLARTESSDASNEIAEVAYKQSGIVTKKEWFANPGACPRCRALAGTIISLGVSFIPKGTQFEGSDGTIYNNDYKDVKHPPAEPNCRCTVIPVIDEIKLSSSRIRVVNKIAARELPGLLDGIDTVEDNDLGCIMISTEKLDVLKHVDNAKDDLSKEVTMDRDAVPGENAPHVTLLYGLLDNGNIVKKNVDTALKGWSIKSVKIEKVDFFDTPKNYAVIAHIEKTKELVDGHERLTLLPNRQTFSEYKPHLTLAYIDKNADVKKWIKALGEVYNGKTIKTTGIDYGDLPDDE